MSAPVNKRKYYTKISPDQAVLRVTRIPKLESSSFTLFLNKLTTLPLCPLNGPAVMV